MTKQRIFLQENRKKTTSADHFGDIRMKRGQFMACTMGKEEALLEKTAKRHINNNSN